MLSAGELPILPEPRLGTRKKQKQLVFECLVEVTSSDAPATEHMAHVLAVLRMSTALADLPLICWSVLTVAYLYLQLRELPVALKCADGAIVMLGENEFSLADALAGVPIEGGFAHLTGVQLIGLTHAQNAVVCSARAMSHLQHSAANIRGNCLSALLRHKDALEVYRSALELVEERARRAPGEYSPMRCASDTSGLLINIGNQYQKENLYEKALGAYDKSLTAVLPFADQPGGDYLVNRARHASALVLINLPGRKAEARKLLADSVPSGSIENPEDLGHLRTLLNITPGSEQNVLFRRVVAASASLLPAPRAAATCSPQRRRMASTSQCAGTATTKHAWTRAKTPSTGHASASAAPLSLPRAPCRSARSLRTLVSALGFRSTFRAQRGVSLNLTRARRS